MTGAARADSRISMQHAVLRMLLQNTIAVIPGRPARIVALQKSKSSSELRVWIVADANLTPWFAEVTHRRIASSVQPRHYGLSAVLQEDRCST